MPILILFLIIFPLVSHAGVTLEFDSDTYWPGQPIHLTCSYSGEEEKHFGNLYLNSYLTKDLYLPISQREDGRGFHSIDGRKELRSGQCESMHAPLIPGEYVYLVRWQMATDIMMDIPITVTALPPSSNQLEVLRTHSKDPDNPHYSLLADIGLEIEQDWCYGSDLNPRSSQLFVIDNKTGNIFSKANNPDLYCAAEGQCQDTIDGYHCLKSGRFEHPIKVPRENEAGDWKVALVVADMRKCTNGCENLSDYEHANLNIVSAIPYANYAEVAEAPPAPSTDDICERGEDVFYGNPVTLRYAVPITSIPVVDSALYQAIEPLGDETGNLPGLAGTASDCGRYEELKSYGCDAVIGTDNLDLAFEQTCSDYLELKSYGCDQDEPVNTTSANAEKIDISAYDDCTKYQEYKSAGCDAITDTKHTEGSLNDACSGYTELTFSGCEQLAFPEVETTPIELLLTLRPVYIPGEPSTVFMEPAGLANFSRPLYLFDEQIGEASILFYKQLNLIQNWRQKLSRQQMAAVLDQTGPDIVIPLVDPAIEQLGDKPKYHLAMSCGSLFETKSTLSALSLQRNKSLQNKKRLQEYIERNKGWFLIPDDAHVKQAEAELAKEQLALAKLNADIAEKEAYVTQREKVLNRDDREREIEAIKNNPERLAKEQLRRRDEMIAAGKDVARYRMELLQGRNEYTKQLAVLETMGRGAQKRGLHDLAEATGKDWVRLHTAQRQWEANKNSTLQARIDDEEKLQKQNELDQIGPTVTAFTLLTQEGVNANQVLYAGSEAAGQRGVLQAKRDAKTLGGSATVEYHIEDLAQHIKQTNREAVLSPSILVKRYGAFGKGVGNAGVDAVKEVVDLGIKAGKVAGETAEFYYEEIKNQEYGYAGDSELQKIAGGIEAVAKLNPAEIKDKALAGLEQLSKAANRKVEQLAGRGEAGTLEALELAGYTTAVVMGADELILRKFISSSQIAMSPEEYIQAKRAIEKPRQVTKTDVDAGLSQAPLEPDLLYDYVPPEQRPTVRMSGPEGSEQFDKTKRLKKPGEVDPQFEFPDEMDTELGTVVGEEPFEPELTYDYVPPEERPTVRVPAPEGSEQFDKTKKTVKGEKIEPQFEFPNEGDGKVGSTSEIDQVAVDQDAEASFGDRLYSEEQTYTDHIDTQRFDGDNTTRAKPVLDLTKDLTKDLAHQKMPEAELVTNEIGERVRLVDPKTGEVLFDFTDKKIGEGGVSSVYRKADDVGPQKVVKVTEIDPDPKKNLTTLVSDQVGAKIGREIQKDSKYFRFTDTLEEPMVVVEKGRDGAPDKSYLVTVEESIESLDNGKFVSNAYERFENRAPNAGERATMNLAIREMNRKGVVWTDHKMNNFDIVPANTPTGYKMVIFDKGGIVPAVGNNATEKFNNARKAQKVFDRLPLNLRQVVDDVDNAQVLLDGSVYGDIDSIDEVLIYTRGTKNRGKKYKYLELDDLSPKAFEAFVKTSTGKEIKLPPVSPD